MTEQRKRACGLVEGQLNKVPSGNLERPTRSLVLPRPPWHLAERTVNRGLSSLAQPLSSLSRPNFTLLIHYTGKLLEFLPDRHCSD